MHAVVHAIMHAVVHAMIHAVVHAMVHAVAHADMHAIMPAGLHGDMHAITIVHAFAIGSHHCLHWLHNAVIRPELQAHV